MRRLLVVCDGYGAFKRWCSEAHLPPFGHQIVYCSPHQNPNKWRGFGEHNIAIVWADEVHLPEKHNRVLEIYVSLGCRLFEPDQHDLIRAWLSQRETRPQVEANAFRHEQPPADLDDTE